MPRSGWKPSSFDGRDLQFMRRGVGDPLPNTVALSHPFAPRNQGDVPCCVSIAIATAMEMIDQRTPPTLELSPLFHYYTSRSNPNSLGLLDLRTGLDSAVNTGICRARHHNPPYDGDGARLRPSRAAYVDAERQKLAGFYTPTEMTQYEIIVDADAPAACRDALAAGYPIVIGFFLTSAYWSISKENPHHSHVPKEPSRDGHAVVAVGYSDEHEALRIKDSRGTGFADGGHWWLPYSALNSRLIHEMWVLRKITYE